MVCHKQFNSFKNNIFDDKIVEFDLIFLQNNNNTNGSHLTLTFSLELKQVNLKILAHLNSNLKKKARDRVTIKKLKLIQKFIIL